MNTLRHVVLVAAGLIAFSSGALRAAVESGKPAPDFSLTDLSGQKRSLSDFKGKVVVLEWNNPGCPIVGKHYNSGNMPKLQQSATADGVVWLVVNSGSSKVSAVKEWLTSHSAAPTAYLRDEDGTVGHLYGARTTPHMYVVDKNGVLVYQGAIDSIPSADKADIPKATNYVAKTLEALKVGKPVEPSATKPYGCAVKYSKGGT